MMTSTTNAPTFHEGERALQQRAGIGQRLDDIGPRVIRNFMPEQHRAFFTQLPFIVAGSVDEGGQPWASILASAPGFISSADPTHLTIHASRSVYDPLHNSLHTGAKIGLLGIEPHTRRRNRANGVVESVTEDEFSVRVLESFGNCPKYIQARRPHYVPHATDNKRTVHTSTRLDDAARVLISKADTFFIATAYPVNTQAQDSPYGVDVSHRGGKSGFIRVSADGTLTVPDFVGNYFFNTLGNIAVNPKAGLLFLDFDSGDLLYLAVHTSIIWDGPEVDAYQGAVRLLEFSVREARRVESGVPLVWGNAELSPALEQTGAWQIPTEKP